MAQVSREEFNDALSEGGFDPLPEDGPASGFNFGSLLNSALGATPGVIAALNPRTPPARPKPATRQQQQLLMYGLIGGGILIVVLIVLSLGRK
jgi:hypothetical protein